MAIIAVKNPKRVEGLIPYFFLAQKVITPRLLAKVNYKRELFRIANTTNHRYVN